MIDSNEDKTDRNVEIDQFLRGCNETELRSIYEKINKLLSMDFVPRLPAEVCDQIFAKLSYEDLIAASQTSKAWYAHTIRESIWSELCRSKGWNQLENELKNLNQCAKFRSLYYRAAQLEQEWKSGEVNAESSLFLHRNRIETMAIGHGDVIATGDRGGRLTISKFHNENLAIEHQLDFGSAVNSIKITGFYIVVGLADGTCRIVNSVTGNELAQFTHPVSIEDVQVCYASNTVLLLGGRHYTIIDLKEGIVKFVQHFDQEMEISSANTTRAMTIITFWNGTIIKVNLTKGDLTVLAAQSDDAMICTNVDKSRAVTGGSDGSVMGWDLSKNQLLFNARSSTTNDVYSVACKGENVASADCLGVITLWSWTGQVLNTLREHVGAIRSLQYHPNFDVLVSAGDAKFLCLWDGITGRFIKRFIRNNINIHLMALSSRHIVIASPASPGKLVSYHFHHSTKEF